MGWAYRPCLPTGVMHAGVASASQKTSISCKQPYHECMQGCTSANLRVLQSFFHSACMQRCYLAGHGTNSSRHMCRPPCIWAPKRTLPLHPLYAKLAMLIGATITGVVHAPAVKHPAAGHLELCQMTSRCQLLLYISIAGLESPLTAAV
jgi:hypothetical protein